MQQVREALGEAGLANADFLDVDLFLWWVQQPREETETVDNLDVAGLLQDSLSAQGLVYGRWQVAAFWTALQTKGFVILSGVSGTGKTRLAQHIAEIFPQPSSSQSTSHALTVALTPSLLKTGRIPLRESTLHGGAAHVLGTAQEVVLSFDGHSQNAPLLQHNGERHLVLRGAARQWLQRSGEVGEQLLLEPEIDADRDTVLFRLFTQAQTSRRSIKPDAELERNLLFLPVRPDWHDSRSLLGYYNPLSAQYEWTPFLRFLWRAVQSFRARDGLAWFVLLDEMNLARVEHYFADVLSVLESGRDEAGWTRAALSFSYPASAEGELPPRELYLPPNLYFVGTVNVDETTHAFSPKVLDRAWTLPLHEIDFRDYPPQGQAHPAPEAERRQLLQNFNRNGRFILHGKADITGFLEAHFQVRSRLQLLNEQLQPNGLAFGYRTFDEIVWFLQTAQENGLWDSFDEAFDVVIMTKILPKFHGARARLEAPLKYLLAWSLNPDAPDETGIAAALEVPPVELALHNLASLPFRLPHTARLAGKLWRDTQIDGYAAFG
jgi:energy-coupling factor transporter ATP-binding protein EcfA2